MKILTGIDLVDVSQFRDSVRHGGENFLQKIFTDAELENPDPIHLAGLFAAKEAILKALSLKPGRWLSIEVKSQKTGRLTVKLPENNRKVTSYDLSVSHSENFAIAVFVAVI